jgi:polyadenylate-binding protein
MKAHFTNLFVKNVAPDVTPEEFQALFEPHGTITSIVLQLDDEGKSRGFGFVNYEDHEQAQAAVDTLHDIELKGQKLFVGRAQKKAEREEELRRSYEQAKMEKMSKYQGVNLYVKNVDDDWDDDRLRSEFEAIGTITSSKIMRDDKGVSKGFGFVCFATPEEATRAVTEMNNKMVGSKPLYVCLAQRKEARRQQLESQIAQRNQIRMQQAAVANMAGGAYMNGPMYYPPAPGGYPPQGQRGVMGYPGPGMIPPRPRYTPSGQPLTGMPVPAPYGQQTPQAYGAPPNYPRPPRPTGPPREGQPPAAGGPAPRPGQPQGAAPVNGARPAQGQAVPPGGIPTGRAPPAGAPAPGRQPGYKGAAASRPQAAGTAPVAAAADGITLTSAALANASPMEQKQMLGEVLFLKISPYVLVF